MKLNRRIMFLGKGEPSADDVIVDFGEEATNRQEVDICWEQHATVKAMVREWQIELCWQASRPWRDATLPDWAREVIVALTAIRDRAFEICEDLDGQEAVPFDDLRVECNRAIQAAEQCRGKS